MPTPPPGGGAADHPPGGGRRGRGARGGEDQLRLRRGQSDVTLNFAWGTHLEQAANDLRDRLDRVVPSLPDEADRPRVRQVDLGDTPIMIIGVSGPLDPIELRRLVDDQMAYRLERLPGVGAIDIWGGLEREIEVGVDPGRLQSLGLTLDSVRDALVEADFEVAAGGLEEGRYDRALRIPGRFTDLDALQEITIARAEGAFVRLGQLAEIRDTHQRETRRIRINGEPGIRLAVRKQSEANTVATARELRRELARMDRDFPPSRYSRSPIPPATSSGPCATWGNPSCWG